MPVQREASRARAVVAILGTGGSARRAVVRAVEQHGAASRAYRSIEELVSRGPLPDAIVVDADAVGADYPSVIREALQRVADGPAPPIVAVCSARAAAATAVCADGVVVRPFRARDVALALAGTCAAHARHFDRLTALTIQRNVAVLAALVGGIAHEINTPLASVLSNVESARDALARARPDGPDRAAVRELRAALDDSLAGGRRIADIVRELQSVGAAAAPEGLVDLRSATATALGLLGARLRAVARLVERLGSTATVEGDEPSLVRAIVQILVHAERSVVESVHGARLPVIRVRTWTDTLGRACFEVSVTPGASASRASARNSSDDRGPPALRLSLAEQMVNAAGGRLVVSDRRSKAYRIFVPP